MAHTPDAPPTAPSADEAGPAPRRGFLAAGWAKFSDNAIPSLVVAVIAGLVLFFFNETGDRITRLEASIDARFAAVDARFASLEENQQEIAVTLAALIGEFAAFREDVDNRFAAVDARFAAVDARFASVDARFDAIETRLAGLEENQQEIAVTLARLLALFEAQYDSPAEPPG